jgi:hypothetical protein
MASDTQSEGTDPLNKPLKHPRLLETFGNMEVMVVKD